MMMNGRKDPRDRAGGAHCVDEISALDPDLLTILKLGGDRDVRDLAVFDLSVRDDASEQVCDPGSSEEA